MSSLSFNNIINKRQLLKISYDYEKKKHQLTGDTIWKINDIDLAITDGGSSIVKDFIDENKYDTGGNISNTELENTLDKRYSSNSNLKNISYDLEISENLLESLSADLSEDLLKIRKNIFLEKEIGKAFLVVAATSNREENHHIAELCHAYNVLVNVADSEEESSFIFPSVVRKGDISIGINSGTGSPTVSKHIRKQIEKAVPDYYADIAVFMGKLREYVKANFKEESQRRYILKTAAAEAFAEERVLTQKEIEEIIRQGQK